MLSDAILRSPGGLSLGTPTVPAPAGTVQPGTRPKLIVTAPQWHPSNVLDLVYRLDQGPVQTLHSSPLGATPGSQAFATFLPALRPGQRLDYRAELRRAGRLISAFPDATGWNTVTASDGAPAAPSAQMAQAAPSAMPGFDVSGKPRFGYGLEFLGALTVHLRAEVVGQTPQGFRINFLVVDGEAHGPRLKGRIRPSGGDWMCIRPDGVGEVDIKITYETPDGALLLEQSGGVFNLGVDGYANVLRGVYTGAPPFFATPAYVTAHPQWQWINSLQCFGFGRVVMSALRVECDIYAPRIESQPPLS